MTNSVVLENTVVMDLPIDNRVKSFLAKRGSGILNISDINDSYEILKDKLGPTRIIVFDTALTKGWFLLHRNTSFSTQRM